MVNERTYMWQEQPQTNWKGQGTTSAVPGVAPSWSRPSANGPRPAFETPLGPNAMGAKAPRYSAGGSRPLKIWRKRVVPTKGSGGGRAGIGMPQDRPNGLLPQTGRAGMTELDLRGKPCCGGGTPSSPGGATANMVTGVYPLQGGFPKPNHHKDSFLDANGQAACVACNPENQVIRRATTVLSKKYYTDSRAYLKARGRRYDQNLGTGSRIGGAKYEGGAGQQSVLWPSDNHEIGPPRYLTADCACHPSGAGSIGNRQPARGRTLIYKPNNRKFGVQGAVQSSTRLDRLKLDTINNGAASQKTDWGKADAQAARYSGIPQAPYRLKSKYNP